MMGRILFILLISSIACADTDWSALGTLSETPALTDEFLVNDGGTFKIIQYQYLMPVSVSALNDIGNPTANGTVAMTDKVQTFVFGAGSAWRFQGTNPGDYFQIGLDGNGMITFKPVGGATIPIGTMTVLNGLTHVKTETGVASSATIVSAEDTDTSTQVALIRAVNGPDPYVTLGGKQDYWKCYTNGVLDPVGNATINMTITPSKVSDTMKTEAVAWVIGNGTDAITTGVKATTWVCVPFKHDVAAIKLWTDGNSGAITVDVWADEPSATTNGVDSDVTDADSLFDTASEPAISDASSDAYVSVASFDSGDATDLPAGTWYVINVDSATTLTRAYVTMTLTRKN